MVRGRSERRRAAGVLGVLAVAPLCAGTAAAQTSDAEISDAPALRTPAVVVHATPPAEIPDDPTAFSSVIEVEQFAGEAKTLPEIIAESVGVQVRRFGGPGDAAEISIRGSTANQVVVLLDGVRLNTAQSGSVDLSTIPRDLVERIEITRGGGSMQTGSDAIGGVVNIVTRRPSTASRTTGSFSAGSWSTFNGSLGHTGEIAGLETSLGYDGFGTAGDWEFRAADRRIDGQLIPGPEGSFTRVNNDSERHSVLLRVARDLSDRTRLRFTDSFLHDEGGAPGPDSGGGALLGQSLSARRKRIRNLADIRLDFADAEPLALSGDARLFHRYDRARFDDPQPRLGPPVESDNRNHSLGGRGNLQAEFAAGFSTHRASLGLESRGDWLRSADFGDPSRWMLGIFAQDEVGFLEKRLRLVPGLRFDQTQGFGGEWLPRFGLVAQLTPWLSLRGNVERAYRVPNFDELYFDEEFVRGNPNLEPEDALEADLGFDLRFQKLGPVSDLWLEFALFRNDIEESIVFQRVNPFVVAATNTGPALARGIELAGRLRFFDWVGLLANWTRLDTEAERTGNPLPGRPQDEVLVRLDVGPRSQLFKLVGERLYTSSIPVTADGGTRVSSRAVWNVSGSLDLIQLPYLGQHLPGERLLCSVSVDNVSDQSVRDAQFFPQPGRWFTFRLEWQL